MVNILSYVSLLVSEVEDNACIVLLQEDWQDGYQNLSSDDVIMWNCSSEINMSFVCAFVLLENNKCSSKVTSIVGTLQPRETINR